MASTNTKYEDIIKGDDLKLILSTADNCMLNKDWDCAIQLYERSLELNKNLTESHKQLGYANYYQYYLNENDIRQIEVLTSSVYHFESYQTSLLSSGDLNILGISYMNLASLLTAENNTIHFKTQLSSRQGDNKQENTTFLNELENKQKRDHVKLCIVVYERAIAIFKQSIAKDSKLQAPYNNIGLCYLNISDQSNDNQRSHLEKALDFIKKGKKIDQESYYTYKNLAEYYIRLAKLTDEKSNKTSYLNMALQHYEKACMLDKTKTDAVNITANTIYDLAKYSDDSEKETFYFRAIKTYQKVIEKDSTYYHAYYNSGLCYFELSQLCTDLNKKSRYLNLAIQNYSKALSIHPSYTKAKHENASCLLLLAGISNNPDNLNLIAEAKKLYKSLTETDKDNEYNFINVGICCIREAALKNELEREDNIKEAISLFKQSLKTKKKSLNGLYYWGVFIQYLSYRDEEIKAYINFVKKTNTPRAYWELGNMYYVLKDNERALHYFKHGLEILHPEHEREFPLLKSYLYFDSGNALVNLHRFDEGIYNFQESQNAFNGNYIYALHNIAHYTGRKGNHLEANEKWANVLQIYDEQLKNDISFSNLSLNWYYAGSLNFELKRDFETAEKLFENSWRLDTGNMVLLKDMNVLYSEKIKKLIDPDLSLFWKIRQNIEHAERVIESYLCNDEQYFDLAYIYFMDEQYKKALEYTDLALHINSENTNCINLKGLLEINDKNYSKAIAHFKTALHYDPYNMDIRNNLANAYIKLKDFDKAEQEYKSILKSDYYNVDAHIGLGDVFLIQAEEKESDMDMFELSEMHFKKAISYGRSKSGSRRLGMHEHSNNEKRIYKDLDLADIYYSLGYLKIKQFEKKSIFEKSTDRYLLNEAFRYFRQSLNSNPEHYKAKRAKAKIREKITDGRKDQLIDKVGPWLVSGLAFLIFFFAQLKFYFPEVIDKPQTAYHSINESSLNYLTYDLALDSVQQNKLYRLANIPFNDRDNLLTELSGILEKNNISPEQLNRINAITTTLSAPKNNLSTGHYIFISFATLLLIIAGLYLPQLLKLKIGSIELEKNVASETTGITNFKISTPHTK